MLEKLREIDWASIRGPGLYRPENVADAVRGLATFKGKENSAIDIALSTFGNDHCGTYYPVILTVIPFLREILSEGDAEAQMSTICVLDQLSYFYPEPEFFELPDGSLEPLELHFRRALIALRPALEVISVTGNSVPRRNLANMFLDRLSQFEKMQA